MRFYLYWTFILACVPFLLRKPYWGLIIYSCMNIIRPEELFWGQGFGNVYHSMAIIMLALAFGTLRQKDINFSRLKTRELFFMVLMYAATIASIVFSEYQLPRQYYYANEIIKTAVLCGFLLLLCKNKKDIIKYENFILCAFFLLAIWGIEQHFRGNYRLEKLGGFDSNGVASLFVLFSPIGFIWITHSLDKRKKALGFLITVIIVAAILLTESRGGLLGLIAALFIYFLYSKKKILILSLVAVLIVLASPFISKYTYRAQETVSEGMGPSAASRIILWQAGLMIFTDNPILGTGLLSFPLEKFKYEERFMSVDPDLRKATFRYDNPRVTHNSFIKMLSDTGLLGAIPYFLLFFVTFESNRRTIRRIKEDDQNRELIGLLQGINSGLVGAAVCYCFIDAIFVVFPYVQIFACSVIRRLLLNGTEVTNTPLITKQA